MAQHAGTKRRLLDPMNYMLGAIWMFGESLITKRLDDVMDQYSEAFARFYQFEEEFRLDPKEIHEKAARLIMREGKFIAQPSQREHAALNKGWGDLTESMVKLMEMVNVTPDRKRFRDFAAQVSEFRTEVLRG